MTEHYFFFLGVDQTACVNLHFSCLTLVYPLVKMVPLDHFFVRFSIKNTLQVHNTMHCEFIDQLFLTRIFVVEG